MAPHRSAVPAAAHLVTSLLLGCVVVLAAAQAMSCGGDTIGGGSGGGGASSSETTSAGTGGAASVGSATSGSTTSAASTGGAVSSATATGGGTGGAMGGYSTSFPLTEDPISENGMWITGKAVGIDWNDARTTPGKAFGAAIATGYNDPTAVLTTNFGPDQYAQGTVFRVAGYSPGVSHEVELLLHFHITANDAHGYEVLWAFDGHLAIVRWNGPVSSYLPLLDNVDIGKAIDGDVLRAEITGGVINVYKNGAMVATGPQDTMWSDGQPGMGFWPTPGATPENYCWKSYSAGGL